MIEESLLRDAKSLLQAALQGYDEHYGFGTMSCAVYDTAWVSMVTKTINGNEEWLFPECFKFLLDTQSATGGWEIGNGAPIDGILNTAASLLALKRHSRALGTFQLRPDEKEDLEGRSERATASLRSQLAAFDVSTTEHVGFEIILPALLDLLEAQDVSLVFEFPARESLMKIRDAKMSRFRPDHLYGKEPSTAVHSLEAFVGKIDFDKVHDHKTNGSMMGSPSSTAAYLMYASMWDEESEAYLAHVIRYSAGRGTGGVPSAFPSTHFESSWILTTLFRAGFSPSQLACDELDMMAEILGASLKEEGGVIGYAPGFQADVDDTAKAITCLSKLGKVSRPLQMVKIFEANTHFCTYQGERDPSLTANCNALSALLEQPDAARYGSQIQKTTQFLCDYWWHSDGQVRDKWNSCPLYPSLLLVEALMDLIYLVEQGKLPGVLEQDLRHRIAITLFQACLRPLLDQDVDGSWQQSVEATAYGTLILSEARRLAFFERLRAPLDEAIQRALDSLELAARGDGIRPNYIWIEKVSYASPLLTKSYLIAARWASRSTSSSLLSDYSIGASLWTPPRGGLDKHVRLFHQTELFNSSPEWELRASMIEAALFTPMLRAHRLDVFPRHDVDDDKYLDVVPFFWTSANNRTRTYASTVFLYDMCFIAMLNFQLDEFMEATAGELFRGRFDQLRQIVHDLLDDKTGTNASKWSHTVGRNSVTRDIDSGVSGLESSSSDSSSDSGSDALEKDPECKTVFSAFSKFLKHVLQHPSIQSSSTWDRTLLARELRSYLLAHIQQAEDSIPGRGDTGSSPPDLENTPRWSTNTTTFFQWVRTTSADHISCPYSFQFVACHLSASLSPKSLGKRGDCFPSAGEKYLAAATCRHLAAMCRMYNDLGSAERDRDEGNLNSLDFAEFEASPGVSDSSNGSEWLEDQKRVLFRLAEFERASYLDVFRRLQDESKLVISSGDATSVRHSHRRMAILQFFFQQIDLYGQVYIIQDISARIPKKVSQGNST